MLVAPKTAGIHIPTIFTIIIKDGRMVGVFFGTERLAPVGSTIAKQMIEGIVVQENHGGHRRGRVRVVGSSQGGMNPGLRCDVSHLQPVARRIAGPHRQDRTTGHLDHHGIVQARPLAHVEGVGGDLDRLWQG